MSKALSVEKEDSASLKVNTCQGRIMANILLVDDAMFMRSKLKMDINQLVPGCEFSEASNGVEAVDAVSKDDFDLIFLDITMPVMDGLTAIKKIRSMKPNQKVVMCSAMGQEFMVVEAIQSGAIDFMVKPFKFDRLAALLRTCGLL